MTTIATKTIRQRVEAAVAGVTGFHPARTIGDMFGLDPNSYAHKAFSVDLPTTTDGGISRQNSTALSIGARVTSTARIRWTYRIKAKRAATSMDSALDAESAIVAGVMAISQANLHIRFMNATRTIEPRGEWLIGELNFSTTHHFALE
jgi:hypothetical protein